MQTLEEDKQYLINQIGNLKSGLFYSKHVDCYTYDKVCDLLDIVANIIDDELKEREEI